MKKIQKALLIKCMQAKISFRTRPGEITKAFCFPFLILFNLYKFIIVNSSFIMRLQKQLPLCKRNFGQVIQNNESHTTSKYLL